MSSLGSSNKLERNVVRILDAFDHLFEEILPFQIGPPKEMHDLLFLINSGFVEEILYYPNGMHAYNFRLGGLR